MQHTHPHPHTHPHTHTHTHTPSSCDKLWSQFCCNPVPGTLVLWTAKILFKVRDKLAKEFKAPPWTEVNGWVSSAREWENCLCCLILIFVLTFSKWHSINWVQLSLSAGFTCTVSPSLYRFHTHRQMADCGTRAPSNSGTRPGSWGPSPLQIEG